LKKNYQVIIVGAGPSGIATALSLKKLGINDVLVIERQTFPRYKCCAGYITKKTKAFYEKFGLDIDQCHYSLIKDFSIFYQLKSRQTIINKFLYTNDKIDRVELDNAFFELAKSKGISILENTSIKSHDILSHHIILNNDKEVSYQSLVFADGTTGFGSRYQRLKHKNIAMQVTFPNHHFDEIQIHFGVTKKGYAWVSSSNGITNVGITDVYHPSNHYMEIFLQFLKDLNLKVDEKDIHGAFTPIGVGKAVIHDSIFFVGDAVGACDPFTLSGLRYGLKSGEVCANAISKGKNSIYQRYVYSLKFKFTIMKIIQKVFYLKVVLFLVFNVGCKYFHKLISYAFNHFFVNKK